MSTLRSRTAGSVRGFSRARDARSGRDSRFRPGKPMPKPRAMAKRSAPNSQRTIPHSWCSTANSRRSRSTRCFSNRKAALPGMTLAARTSSLSSACNRLTRPRNRSPIYSAMRRRPSGRRASTTISPIAVVDSAVATIPRSHSTSHLRRCFSRTVRCGSRTTASSNFNWESSGTPSRSAHGLGSIGRPARWSDSPPTMRWMAEALPISPPKWRPSAPTPRLASTTSRKSM